MCEGGNAAGLTEDAGASITYHRTSASDGFRAESGITPEVTRQLPAGSDNCFGGSIR